MKLTHKSSKHSFQTSRSFWRTVTRFFSVIKLNFIIKQTHKPQLKNKKYKGKRIKQKRLKEQVYLAHFLAVQGLRPTRIISGLDDGKEPDFTILLNDKVIGIELTTLPRLRERMPNNFIQWRLAFWTAQRFSWIPSLSLGSNPKTKNRALMHRKSYDPHHMHFQHDVDLAYQFQYRHSHLNHFSHTHLFSPHAFTSPSFFSSSLNTDYSSHHSHTHTQASYCSQKRHNNTIMQRFLKLAKQIEKTIPPSQSYFINPNQLTSSHHAAPVHVKEQFIPCNQTLEIGTISQTDVDAVMKKKAHKVTAYQERRPLDEIWLLVHSNCEHPTGALQLPESDTEITHESDYDAVFLTVFPYRSVYRVSHK